MGLYFGAPGGFPRYPQLVDTCGAFVSTQTAPKACFRLLIVERVRVQIAGCTITKQIPTNKSWGFILAHPADSLSIHNLWIPAGHSLALKLRQRLVFAYSLSNACAFKSRGAQSQNKSPRINRGALFWRTRRDSNAQSPPSEGDALSS